MVNTKGQYKLLKISLRACALIFGGNYDIYLHIIEFTSNNSDHFNILDGLIWNSSWEKV